MRALEAQLAALQAEMQDFTYTVSHDLRASLRHILSYAQLVQEDAAPLLPPETLGFVHTIADSARHMGTLMDGLMELSRLGTVAIDIQPVALQDLVADAVAELQAQHPEAALDWQIQAGLPEVRADATQLRAALMAVLDNAVKFSTHQGQRRIAVRAQSATSDTGAPCVDLEVEDNGAGFNPALQAKLFKPFQRLHTARQFPGIGMGLALTRKRLGRMDAQVWAEASVDAGCTIHMRLPAAP